MVENPPPVAGDTHDAQQDRSSRTKPRRRRWAVVLILVVAAAAGLFLILRKPVKQPESETQAAPIATIQIARARRGDIGVYVDALGTVTPISTINVFSQITGRVTAVHYTEGQMIESGEPLIDIDPQPYEAQLEEVQGTLEHDQAMLAQAEIDLKRYREASTNQSIPRQQLEDQEQAVVQYHGTVKNDLGQVRYAQVQLSYCHITAPASGRVGLRLVDTGNTIFSGSTNPLVVITQLQPITVIFNVAEDSLFQVRDQILHPKGLAVEAFDRSQEKRLGTGHLLTIDNQVDTTTGTVRFRGEFDNRDMSLFPNQFVNVRLLVKTLRNVLLVPSAAVQRDSTQAFAYVQAGDKVKTRQIKVITTEGDISAVEGLAAGDVVATTGFDKLDDDAKVTVQAAPAATGTSTKPTPAGRGDSK
jgi:multidrug efflux system membrane fusion protein